MWHLFKRHIVELRGGTCTAPHPVLGTTQTNLHSLFGRPFQWNSISNSRETSSHAVRLLVHRCPLLSIVKYSFIFPIELWQRGVLNWEVEALNTTLPRPMISQWFMQSSSCHSLPCGHSNDPRQELTLVSRRRSDTDK